MAESKQHDTKSLHKHPRAAESAMREAAHRVDDAARQSAGAAEQGGRTAADLARRGSEAMAEAARQGGEAVHRGAHALAEGRREFVQGAAEQFEDAGRRLIRTMQQTTEDWTALMTPPSTAGGSLQNLQQNMANFIEGVNRTNVRAAQDLFRLNNPGTIIDLQRRFARDYLDAIMQGSALMARATHRIAEEALRPLEAAVEQRERSRREEPPHAPSSGLASRQDGKVADVMSPHVRVIGPDDTVQQAARIMRDQNVGALPVGEGDKLVGMLTDRDVALRLVAEGRDPARTKVREVMTPDVRYIFEDEELGHAAENMAEQNVRRLPVVNRDKRLVGVLSLGDLVVPGNQRWLAGRQPVAAPSENQPAHAAAE